jgi:hypothetical protein
MNARNTLLTIVLSVAFAGTALADGPVPSQHQLVKECMEKQKEADSGKSKDDLRAFCRDWAKTQREADKQQAPAKS